MSALAAIVDQNTTTSGKLLLSNLHETILEDSLRRWPNNAEVCCISCWVLRSILPAVHHPDEPKGVLQGTDGGKTVERDAEDSRGQSKDLVHHTRGIGSIERKVEDDAGRDGGDQKCLGVNSSEDEHCSEKHDRVEAEGFLERLVRISEETKARTINCGALYFHRGRWHVG